MMQSTWIRTLAMLWQNMHKIILQTYLKTWYCNLQGLPCGFNTVILLAASDVLGRAVYMTDDGNNVHYASDDI